MVQWLVAVAALAPLLSFLFWFAADPALEARLNRHRNLGKAFYENPTTQKEAVEELRKALDLAPKSSRERLNYGLALMRAGRTDEGMAELEAVQKQDGSIPHTWFNLGIAFKKAGEEEKAIQQIQRFVALVPDDPAGHYNLGSLYKLTGKTEEAIREFQLAAKLDPALAAPHFQLFNTYRSSGRAEGARAELAVFQALKKQQEGAVLPEDVEWNRFAELMDVMEDSASEPPTGEISFRSDAVDGAASGALVLDVSGKGRISLLVWSASGIRLDRGEVFAGVTGVRNVAAGDFNNDGLPDLCALTEAGPVLLANNGNGAFTRSTAALPSGDFRQAVWLDYDHDNDLDLLLLGSHSVLLRNAGAAGFQDRTADFPFVAGDALSAATLRVMPDTKGFDLAVAYAGRTGVLYRDLLQGNYKAEDLPLPAGSAELAAADLNNDGYLDFVFSHAGNIKWLRNKGGRLLPPVDLAAGQRFVVADFGNRGVSDLIAGTAILRGNGKGAFNVAKTTLPEACQPELAADVNDDGRLDLVCTGGDQARVLTNTSTGQTNRWLQVRLQGTKSLKLAPGAEVEVKAGSRYQKRTYQGIPLLFGTGRETTVDTVRITWPNGLIQNETNQATGKRYSWQEAQRLSGSCPIVWSWDGTGFRYITDVLGVAPLGARSGDGRYFPVDHDEYIQIPGEALRPKNGSYEIRITEELSEVAYLDQIRLLAIDHPKNTTVLTNEKFKSPPFPEFRLYSISRRIAPLSASDNRGRNMLEAILHKDGRYAEGFQRDLSGVAEMHSLQLDFGDVPRDARTVLVLNGWVDWADGSTFLRASQEGKGGLVSPMLQVRDASGRWVTILEDMGMPAGKPKTIAVDLTGKWLSRAREVRILTNLSVYWDHIYLSGDAGSGDLSPAVVPLRAAELHFRGFSPARIDPQRRLPEQFTYSGATPQSLWNPTPGFYTRYGDVREIASKTDDRLIVMGSGDELQLRFDAGNLLQVRSDYVRDFLLFVDGWAKDRDANTAFSQTTEPLPFHAMSQYPYPSNESFPDTPALKRWRTEYLTRPALRLLPSMRPD